MNPFRQRFGAGKVLIGMIHLPPLPDYPDSPGIGRIVEHALADLAVLRQFGFEGVLVENEYDRPHRVRATAETVEAMTIVTKAVAAAGGGIGVGCEILLNDPAASLDVAKAAGASFIRTDYFVDRMTRPGYGEFDIDPEGVVRHRQGIGATDVLILADIQVKYASMIEPRSLGASAGLAAREGADAVVVTGSESGDAPGVETLAAAAGDLPVLIGSGLDANNAVRLLDACDGAIVGTALMAGGAVDPARVERLMTALGRC